MDIDTFWNIVEGARAEAAEAGEPLDEVLVRQLADRPRQDLLEYAQRFGELHDTLYRWDVWAAAYLIGGGCSDDGFTDFRAGVIASGRTWFQRVTAAPDSLAAHPDVAGTPDAGQPCGTLFYEEMNYAAGTAFKRITSPAESFHEALRDACPTGPETADEADMGEGFDFEDDEEMSRRLPRLAAMFLGPDA